MCVKKSNIRNVLSFFVQDVILLWCENKYFGILKAVLAAVIYRVEIHCYSESTDNLM